MLIHLVMILNFLLSGIVLDWSYFEAASKPVHVIWFTSVFIESKVSSHSSGELPAGGKSNGLVIMANLFLPMSLNLACTMMLGALGISMFVGTVLCCLPFLSFLISLYFRILSLIWPLDPQGLCVPTTLVLVLRRSNAYGAHNLVSSAL
uniref:Aa_trans domain-containing protein n=1 Tax=Heterorhabditis bacteriophora TaxID=37862 RepID=A0A1I7W8M9_HETBA